MAVSASEERPTPVVLTIAGFDPSSGAGVTADLKVFAAHRLYGMAAITALTVQSTQGVKRVEPVPGDLLRQTLACLGEDTAIAGVKIGMLATGENVGAVAGFLRDAGVPRRRVVLDPVLRSSSGADLLDAEGLAILRQELLPVVGWVTPNLEEMALLSRMDRGTRQKVPEGAKALAGMAAALGNPELNVVVTGGHLERPDDFLRTAAGAEQWFSGEKVETRATHGTGCTFSSALLCQLVIEKSPSGAVKAAKDYVTAAMRAAYPVGRGKGPLHHLYAFGADRDM
jgi:hydroxymethylpyrimidine/phosphomethylpyrimidine kinase